MKKEKLFCLTGMIGLVLTFVVALAGCDNPEQSIDESHPLDGSRYELLEDDELIIMEFENSQFLLAEKVGDGPEEGVQKGPYFVEDDTIYMLLSYEWKDNGWVEPSPRRWGTGTLSDSGNTITMGPATYRYNVYKIR
jgi:hypothetical protein